MCFSGLIVQIISHNNDCLRRNLMAATPLLRRVILASNRGTLMELGVSPIVSAGMVIHLLVGSRMMHFNQNAAEDRVLFQAAEKMCGILFTFVCATAYVVSGMYGPLSAIGDGNAALIVLQLTGAGVILLLLDEMVQKYGIGSGLNLFIAVHICETIVWSALSTTTVTTASGIEMEGMLNHCRFGQNVDANLRCRPSLTAITYMFSSISNCTYMSSHNAQELCLPFSICSTRVRIRSPP